MALRSDVFLNVLKYVCPSMVEYFNFIHTCMHAHVSPDIVI